MTVVPEDDSPADRLEVLRHATDQAAADDRSQWAIISTLLTAISSDRATTEQTLEMLDALTVPRAAPTAELQQALRRSR